MSGVRSRALALGLCAAMVGGSAGAQDNIYFGNLHAHTLYSDGSGTPAQAFQGAKAAGLDFMAVTEHNHKAAESDEDTARIHIARDPTLYNGNQASSLVEAAKAATQDGSFVALYGQEYSVIKKGNHINVFEAPSVIPIPNKEYRQLLEWTAQNPDSTGKPSLLQFNHPALDDYNDLEYGRNQFESEAAWVAAMDAQVELIELFNGPSHEQGTGWRSAAVQEQDYYDYLNLGFHLAPSVGQDNHYFTWGKITDARVAIIAPDLTHASVMAALRARHAYATADKNLRLIFRSGSSLQGDVASATVVAVEEDLPLTLSLKDDDESDASYRIDVFSDVPGGAPIDPERPANTFLLEGNTSAPLPLDGVVFRQSGQYVLVRVTQINDDPEKEDVAWTAPIWFGGSAPTAAGPGAGVAPPPPRARPLPRVVISQVLPDPAGSDFRNERIWVKNNTAQAVSLANWTVVDLSGNVWSLAGSVPANGERYFMRNGQDLSLNNNGDRLELRDARGGVIHTATYGPARRGEEVRIP